MFGLTTPVPLTLVDIAGDQARANASTEELMHALSIGLLVQPVPRRRWRTYLIR